VLLERRRTRKDWLTTRNQQFLISTGNEKIQGRLTRRGFRRDLTGELGDLKPLPSLKH
jgi:hypothetical protein